MQIRKQIRVSGIVQGVGFRPYVYRLASERRLAGKVSNTAAGVVIEVQGENGAIEDFLTSLPAQAPPQALITAVHVAEVACNRDTHFAILPSEKSETVRTLIPPDIAICGDCLRELFDPADRRYLYPFINCTNCGPRFTIVRSIPYDRPQTSMAVFPMCPRCRLEYHDPGNRRFHAQPNACWDCGPRVELWDSRGAHVTCKDPIAEARSLLKSGAILAVKGLGGFHLAVDATHAQAVQRLRERKHRVEKPFAVMVPNVDLAEAFCEVNQEDAASLSSPQRPIVLLPRRGSSAVVEQVAPFNSQLGIFLPYTPVHYLLFAGNDLQALVMTSGNLSEEPIVIDNFEALERLSGVADGFLVHDRDILRRCDDSVVRRVGGRVRQQRRSRGFVPVPVFLEEDLPATLAVGGELKNTVCLASGKQAFLSQHIGDLENAEAYGFFQEAIEHLQNILEIRPAIVAYDLHPNYLSTRWALEQKGVQTVGVQHHHAHIASCMAENHVHEPVIGFAMDGTGYGSDGHIWGGEVLLADYEKFRRAAQLAYVPMPGGSAAIRQPWRMAVSYLLHAFGPGFMDLSLPFLKAISRTELHTILRMVERGVNCPMTSSCGRLFDGVAALIGLRHEVNYEAQAAIELEMCRDEAAAGQPYLFSLHDSEGILQMDPGPAVRSIVDDVLRGKTAGEISQRFHDGLVCLFVEVAQRLRQHAGLNSICLSGGSFQNAYLLTAVEQQLLGEGFRVFTQCQVPAGDGGLSLGQAVVAAHIAKLCPDFFSSMSS